MSLSFGNYVNCLLMIGLTNNLTIVTQGGTPMKTTFCVLWREKYFVYYRIFEYYSNTHTNIRILI